MSEAEIEAALLVTNRNRCKPPLPEEQVKKIARSIVHKVSVMDATRETTSKAAAIAGTYAQKLKALQELPDIMQPIADKAENADSA